MIRKFISVRLTKDQVTRNLLLKMMLGNLLDVHNDPRLVIMDLLPGSVKDLRLVYCLLVRTVIAGAGGCHRCIRG